MLKKMKNYPVLCLGLVGLFLHQSWSEAEPLSHEKNVEIILKWWHGMAEQKPVKCNNKEEQSSWIRLKDTYQQSDYISFDPEAAVVQSYKCEEDDVPMKFSFKGDIVDFKLEGPGKLRLNPSGFLPSDDTYKDVCLKIKKLNPMSTTSSVVGTFKRGRLEGTGKISYADKSSVIGTFKDGWFSGFKREWGSDGQLHWLGNAFAYPHGKTWQRVGSYLVLRDEQIIHDEKQTREVDLVIPLGRESKEKVQIWAGNFRPHMAALENVFEVHVTEVVTQAEDEGEAYCVPKIGWTLGEKQNFVLDIRNDERILLDYRRHENCAVSSDRPEDQFLDWQDRTVNPHLGSGIRAWSNLFSVRPETENLSDDVAKLAFIQEAILDDKAMGLYNLTLFDGDQPSTFHLTEGGLSPNGKFQGHCHLVSHMSLEKVVGSHPLLGWRPAIVEGHFRDGQPDGIFKITTFQGNIIWANLKNGVLHGPIFSWGVSAMLDTEKLEMIKISQGVLGYDGINYFGRFKNGRPVGHFWAGMVGGGNLHGVIDEASGLITGNSISYIYPDGETALLGRFEDKVMKKAKAVDVKKYGCDANGMLIVTEYSEPWQDQNYFYDPPTMSSFGSNTPEGIWDPYETKTVKLAPSTVPNSGDGVIAARDVPAGRFVCMYSLYMYRGLEERKHYVDSCVMNTSRSDEYRRHCKKYSLGFSAYDQIIDLPPEFDKEPYPNLGPKVNHHFRLNNSVYTEVEHPRWGMIQSVATRIPIKAGQEVFTFYGYNKSDLTFPEDFPWYFETLREIERDERLKKAEVGSDIKAEPSGHSRPNKKKSKKSSSKHKKKNKAPKK